MSDPPHDPDAPDEPDLSERTLQFGAPELPSSDEGTGLDEDARPTIQTNSGVLAQAAHAENLSARGLSPSGADSQHLEESARLDFQNAATLKQPAPDESATIQTDSGRLAQSARVDFQNAPTFKPGAPGDPVHGFDSVQGGAYAVTVPPVPGMEPDSASAAQPGSSRGRLASADKQTLSSNKLRVGGIYAGKFELLNEIARGGMGVVYRARQIDLNRVIALKVMLAGNYASEDDRRRFILEAEASARLKHPNIVPVFDIGEVEGNLYFTMDYVEGEPLSKRKAELDRDQLHAVMIKACAGVAYAHQRGIIHRDLKPGNIMMNADNEPLIMDFGLAKQTEVVDSEGRPDSRTQEGQVMGTPHYMPPEQAEGLVSEIDIRSDVWPLGVILYELYCGQLPFQGRGISELMLKIFEHDPIPPRKLDPTIDPDMEAIILKALEKPKEKRYDTAGALQRDLEHLRDGLPISARRATLAYRFQKWSKRNRTAIAVAAAFLLAVCLLGGFGLYQYRESAQQRQLAEREAKEKLAADYRAALGALTDEQSSLSETAATQSRSVGQLFENEGAWRERATKVAPLRARLEDSQARLRALDRSLSRFADASELGLLEGGALRERERELERERGMALEPRLNGLIDELDRLSEAHRGLAEVESQTQRSGERASEAEATLRDPSSDAAARARAVERFEEARQRANERIFGVLALARPSSPERATAQAKMATLQERRMSVQRAQSEAEQRARATRMATQAKDKLASLAERRAKAVTLSGDARRQSDQSLLQGARAAQGLVQEGLEAWPQHPQLDGLRKAANAAYAELLLDLKAFQVFEAEVATQGAFEPKRLAALLARLENERRARDELLSQLKALRTPPPDKTLVDLSVAKLEQRLTRLETLGKQIGSDPDLRRELGLTRNELTTSRLQRGELDVRGALANAKQATSALALAERVRQLPRLEQLWRTCGEEAKRYEAAGRVSQSVSQEVQRAAALGLGTLYRDAALANEADADEALRSATKAHELFVAGKADGELLEQVSELKAALQRRSGVPKGMILVRAGVDQKVTLGGGPGDNNDPREVVLSPYYLAKHEVTVAEYQEFVQSPSFTSDDFWSKLGVERSEVRPPEGWSGLTPPPGSGDLPVTGICFAEARGYAAFRRMRLPYDREWEYAVRWRTSGLEQGHRVFPWGTEFAAGGLLKRLRPPGANARDRAPAGVNDLAGNASEWVVLEDKGTQTAAARGASYLYPVSRIAAAGHRLGPAPDYRGPQLGFRLAKDADTQ